MALATSEVSARVGRGLWIMDSSISVAVITRLPSMRHLVISCFWMAGSFSKGISTPMSPRPIMMPEQAWQISSMFSMPVLFSILAISSMPSAPASSRMAWMSSRSCLRETKEQAMKSTPFSMPKRMSLLSCSLR